MTAPLDVVKTRLQSNLFQTQQTTTATPAGKAVHRHGVRGLLWNFVDTGKIIRCACRLPRDGASYLKPEPRLTRRFRYSDVYVHEGPRALFKGLGPTLAGAVPARFAPHCPSRNGPARPRLIRCTSRAQVNKLFRVREREAPLRRVVQPRQGEFGDTPHGGRHCR